MRDVMKDDKGDLKETRFNLVLTLYDSSSWKKPPWFKNSLSFYLYIAYISLYLDKIIKEQETSEVIYNSEVSRSQCLPQMQDTAIQLL